MYSRDLVGGAIATKVGLPTVYEAHAVFEQAWQRVLWRQMMRRASSSDSSRSRRRWCASSTGSRSCLGPPVVVAHSPASAYRDAFAARDVAASPRVGYVGSLYPGRGIDLVIDIARRMPHCTFELVGGSQADLDRWRATELPANVVFRGFVAPGELPALYRTFDVLLMPYPHTGVHGATARIDSAGYCSPMKMFEYMASGVPMVASDLPVLQEVLVPGRMP